ncbi:hypothetical protein GCM10023189_17360 [Nibrella saemangeumensis]|uniref:Leucine rich repeat-containing protein n=1 Tax=Nibrella saemangeumensis TaxID=1084526 RepID=A0ABP8MRB5_9BACT
MYYFYDDEEDQDETLDDRLWHIRSGLSTTINLSLLDLTKFPEEVFDYPQVTVLRFFSLGPPATALQNAMYRKTISLLPDRISELTNLVELDLTGQQLTELPDSLCNLPRLERLYLRRNQLRALPRRFSRLTSLVCLDVRDNPIRQWPDGFWDMPFINTYKERLIAADSVEYKLLMQKDYETARELRREARRWGLHR